LVTLIVYEQVSLNAPVTEIVSVPVAPLPEMVTVSVMVSVKPASDVSVQSKEKVSPLQLWVHPGVFDVSIGPPS
jgi:hypothetical protein